MKRFVDLRATDTDYNFAWWDTIVDRFESYSESMAWDTWEEFAQDYARNSEGSGAELDRYLRLCPSWLKKTQ